MSHYERAELGKNNRLRVAGSVRTAARGLRKFLWQDQRGALLLETVVASMVFSMIGVAVLAGLSTNYRAGATVDVHSRAENIARNQMEHVFSQTYQEPGNTYTTYSGVPTGFSVTTTATDVDPLIPDPDIERVTVTVARNGRDIISLGTLRFRE